MSKLSKFILPVIGIVVSIALCGCSSKADNNLEDGRATVRLTIEKPDDFNDIISIEFTNAEDDKDKFLTTLSEHNEYGVLLSIPTGDYNITSYDFLSGRAYVIDLQNLAVHDVKEYDKVIKVYPEGTNEDDVAINDKDSNGGIIFVIVLTSVVVLIVCAILVALVISKKKSKVDETVQ